MDKKDIIHKGRRSGKGKVDKKERKKKGRYWNKINWYIQVGLECTQVRKAAPKRSFCRGWLGFMQVAATTAHNQMK